MHAGMPASVTIAEPGGARPSVPWHCAQAAARLRARSAFASCASAGPARNRAVANQTNFIVKPPGR